MFHNADQSIHKAYIKALIDNNEKEIAELQGGDLQIRKLQNDKRITRLGKILRTYSIDEIPQFWNIVKGDMTLVGPRPAIPYELELYKPWYNRRLEAKPGLTGLWQVTARSQVDFEDSIRLDIEYVNHQSFWSDIKILIKTPIAVISSRGAV